MTKNSEFSIDCGIRPAPRIVRSARRKTIVIEVFRDQRVTVRTPARTSQREIAQLLRDKRHWILQQQARQARLPQPVGPLPFAPATQQYFLGNTYPVVESQSEAGLSFDGASFNLSAGLTEAQRTKLSDQWYRQQAQQIFAERLAHVFTHIQHWGVGKPDLRLRKMKRCWGTYSRRGIMTLNTALVKAPVHLLDYVISHELCHIREMNHSPAFYHWQAQLCPDWKTLKNELKSWQFRLLEP